MNSGRFLRNEPIPGYSTKLNRYIRLQEISKHCLDKEFVKEVIIDEINKIKKLIEKEQHIPILNEEYARIDSLISIQKDLGLLTEG